MRSSQVPTSSKWSATKGSTVDDNLQTSSDNISNPEAFKEEVASSVKTERSASSGKEELESSGEYRLSRRASGESLARARNNSLLPTSQPFQGTPGFFRGSASAVQGDRIRTAAVRSTEVTSDVFSNRILPVDRLLPPLTVMFSTDDGKTLQINRREKLKGRDTIAFEIVLQSPNQNPSKYYYSVFISNNNSDYDGKSTVSYPGIYYPKSMQGNRVGYVHHKLIADAAKQIGVEKLL